MSQRSFSSLSFLGAILAGALCTGAAGCGSDDDGGGTGAKAAGGSSGAAGSGGSGAFGQDAGTGGNAGTASGGSAGSSGSGGTTGDAGSCVRTPGPPDGDRVVVVSHTYDANQKPLGEYEVLRLESNGSLTKTGTNFSMGRSTTGEIVFTPDGKLGFVATEKGTVGVFRVEPQGAITVLHAGFSGAFYASKLVMNEAGNRVYVIDAEWRNIGGGIYALDVDCNDKVTDAGMIAPGKLPQGLAFLSGSRAVVPAHDLLASPFDQHVHLVDWSNPPNVITSTTAFGKDTPIISNLAVTQDERYVLVGDNSGFSSVKNRVAVVELDGNALKAVQEVTPIEDPADIETSPFNNTALVSSGFGSALFVLSHHSKNATAPYSFKELSYAAGTPQIPVDMVQIRRGALTGTVLVAEVTGVRQVRFEKSGAPTDVDRLDFGAGVENIVGSIGVQP